MEDRKKIYTAGIFYDHGHSQLVLMVLDQFWSMMSASMVSGQMSFKNITEDMSSWDKDRFKENSKLEEGWEKKGVTTDGRVYDIKKKYSHEELVNPVRNCLGMLDFPLGKDAFLTAEERLPVVSDGPNNYEVGVVTNRQDDSGVVRVMFRPLIEASKHYKLVYDPVSLSYEGDLLTPLTEIFKLVDENVTVFADPFEIRNTARKQGNHNEVKTIRPGLRQKVRKIIVGKRKLASEVNLVDEVTK